MLQIQTVHLGELTIGEENIIHFSKGIPGFEEITEYVLYDIDETYSYLQSVRQAELAFIVTDPFIHFADYEFELSDEVVEELNLNQEKGIAIRSIVTWHSKQDRITANLLAPLVFNVTEKIAKQVVLQNTKYETKHFLYPTHSNTESGES